MIGGACTTKPRAPALAVSIPFLLQALFGAMASENAGSLAPPSRQACPRVCHCDLGTIGRVNCSYRGLTAIPQNIPRYVKTLLLQNNKLEAIKRTDGLSELPNLKELKLDHNKIRSIQRKALPSSLRRLDLKNNRLKVLHRRVFWSLRQLKWMCLADNKIATIKKKVFPPNLETLVLENNHLPEVTSEMFSAISDLEELYLTSNKIRKISADAFPPHLKHLKLDRNRLRRVDLEFSHLTDLRALYLYSNQIESLDDHSFSQTASLHELNILDNELTLIQPRVFENLTKLTTLNLFSNNIRTFDATALPAGKKRNVLKRLYLQHNPLHCDCNMDWLTTLIKEHYLNTEQFDFYFYDDDIPEEKRQFGYPDEDIMCTSPLEHSGQRVEDVISAKYCDFLRAQPTTQLTQAVVKWPTTAAEKIFVSEKRTVKVFYPFFVHAATTKYQPYPSESHRSTAVRPLPSATLLLLLASLLAAALALC